MPESHRPIRPLTEILVNQIAAGEVIERPASVVKELLENSCDAGAREVVVEIEAGGISLIRVRDDGRGIPQGDLAYAVLRHATSKIATAQDLAAIVSLGFRGEALASIGAVARLALTSRPPSQGHGFRIVLEGTATPRPPVPAGHPVGTTVEVRDLFFNTPARRRFLKSEKTELHHLQQVVRLFAHAHPEVGVTLLHGGSRLLKLPAVKPEDGGERRWQGLFGAEFLKASVPVVVRVDGIGIHGRVGLPASARSTADQGMLCVNGRVVRDRGLSHALNLAYAGTLPEGRLPAFGLYLTIDPAAVDVNVHPTKAEVRFREPRMVHDLLYAVVSRALRPPLGATDPVLPMGGVQDAVTPGADVVGGSRQAAHTPISPHLRAAEQPTLYGRAPGSSQAEAISQPGVAAQAAGWRGADGPPPARVAHGASPAPASPTVVVPMGQGHWVLVDEGGICILDRRRAASVLALAALRRAAAIGAVPSRPLLLPVLLPASPAEVRRVEAAASWFAAIGFHLEPAGPQLLRATAAPLVLEEHEAAALAPQLVAALMGSPKGLPALDATLELLAAAVVDLPPPWRDLHRLPALVQALKQLAAEGGTRAFRWLPTAEIAGWFEGAANAVTVPSGPAGGTGP